MNIELIKEFSNINGGSGDEEAIRNSLIEKIKDHVDSTSTNALGNLIAKRNSSKNKKQKPILITAHMDEVSMIVTDIDSSGFIKFTAVGGIVPKILPSTHVKIGKKEIPGIITLKAAHITSEAERNRASEINELFIDIGTCSKDEVKDVKKGDYIYFTSKCFEQGNVLMGKAFDDRAGCAAITEILTDKKINQNILASYNVAEEIGLRGGSVCAFGEDVLFNLNLEGTVCSDVELTNEYTPIAELGKGPAITIMDHTTIGNKQLIDFVKNIADKNKIPCQFKRPIYGGTDAGVISLTEEGIACITLACPVRYIHSPWCMINKDDYENYIKLAKLIVKHAHEFKLK